MNSLLEKKGKRKEMDKESNNLHINICSPLEAMAF